MLATSITQTELLNACKTLFGTEVIVSSNFLKYLQPVGLKTAYRKKAFETHPDRAKLLGKRTKGLTQNFQQVQQAYEILHRFLSSNRQAVQKHKRYQPKTATPRPPAHHSGRSSRQHPARDHFYKGTLPKRSLLFGQFLYYSGRISWKTLIQAVTWQRQQRPRIGQIAKNWGILSHDDIISILRERRFNEKFGECARRIGYITPFEHLAIVGKQHSMQRMIGEYFLTNSIFSPSDMLLFIKKQKTHNRDIFWPHRQSRLHNSAFRTA